MGEGLVLGVAEGADLGKPGAVTRRVSLVSGSTFSS
jgi:hypothetical protein